MCTNVEVETGNLLAKLLSRRKQNIKMAPLSKHYVTERGGKGPGIPDTGTREK
jgi:hypothetical protein